MKLTAILVGVLIVTRGSIAVADNPHWMWDSNREQLDRHVRFQREFQLPVDARRVRLFAVANHCSMVVGVNGQMASDSSKQFAQARRDSFDAPLQMDVTRSVKPGEVNRITVACAATGGPPAIMIKLVWDTIGGAGGEIVSDKEWRCQLVAKSQPLRLATINNAVDTVVQPVALFGQVARHPWGSLGEDHLAISPTHDYTQWKRAIAQGAGTDPASFEVPDGFEVTTVRSAHKDEDSWVCMTFDPQGRIIVAQEKQGLLRFSNVNDSSGELKVERINDSLKECRGLVFVGGDLYAMANNDKALYVLRDTDGDDQFDSVQKIATFEGGVGHGRNQITLGPDGQLYCIFGDSVDEPKSFTKLPPTLARPNDIERTPSGFVARMDLKTRQWTVVVRGLRNPFGIAFNQLGDMFTYDADAEYDMGTPWYRPTRVNHLLPGGDFGWRAVTRRWPPYDPDRPDMPQPTIDIGKGSPTGVAFGTDINFPRPYSNALFVLDWSYGRIIAVHLEPYGSSYAADAEVFLRGQPLNVTDVEFGPDGAMYFTTGGRGTQSSLYRVAYTKPVGRPSKPTPQQIARREFATKSRATRRKLEALFGPGKGQQAIKQAVDTAMTKLSSADPWIRHAARAVIEHQPVDAWRDRISTDEDDATSLALKLALSRVGTESDQRRSSPSRLQSVSETQKFEAIFLLQRFLDANPDDEKRRTLVRNAGSQVYPSKFNSLELNQRLGLLLENVGFEGFVNTTSQLADNAEDDTSRMHWLFLLRNQSQGWPNEKARQAYFQQLKQMSDYVAAEGMPTFLRLIRTEALSAADDRPEFKQLLEDKSAESWLAKIDNTPRKRVSEWKVADFEDALTSLRPTPQSRERGRQVFFNAKCVICHRVNGTGGVSGPDLTAVSQRFTHRDVLVSTLEPSRVVSDKYRNSTFVLKSGKTHVGRLQPGDFRSDEVRLIPNLLEPTKTMAFKKIDVEEHHASPTSPMPKGLVDSFTKEEILDLLSFLGR